jgi:hypothetical protein
MIPRPIRLRPREPGVPAVEIKYTYFGAAECCRCREPLPGSTREITFLKIKGKWRPVCQGCKRKREVLRPWPARDGERILYPGLSSKRGAG